MRNSALFLLVLLLFFSCKRKVNEGKTLFSLLSPSATHVDFTNKLTETEQFNIIEYLYFNNGAGVAAGDINNDGLTDLYFTANQLPDKLYLNKGNLRFEDITEKAGVAGTGDWKTGVTMADVNGDGFLDIYVCHVGNYKGIRGKNELFINQGNLTFQEEAHAYGLDFQGFSTQAAFFDYDMDGDLDMYLLNHSVHTSRSYGGVALRLEQDVRAGDRLYRNDEAEGKRVFHDVTSRAGIFSSQIGYGLGVNICDINNDGFPDIYVSNDFHENDYLYINNGNGTFSERLTDFIAHTSRSSMGNDVGDFNNDGLLDIIVLDMLPEEEKIQKQSGGEDDYQLFELKLKYGYYYQFVRNTLQLNLGGGLFSEIGRLAGIYATDWSWSPLFCDVDNDGWKDLFITNGIYRRANDLDYVKFLTGNNRYFPAKDNRNVPDRVLYEKMPLYPNINYLYHNNGDLTFTNKAKAWGFETRSYSNGSTYADLDNDGDLDLIVNNINDKAFIYRNNAEKRLNNHYLSVKFKGDGLNTRGIGARVTLFWNGRKQVAEQFATRGFMSATSDVLHFGLGQVNLIDSLVVRWPDRSEQIIKNVPADKTITLDMRNAGTPEKGNGQEHDTMKLFAQTRIPGLQYRHKEDPYVDFNRERLIPHSLSAEGPAMAVGDVNGDGLEDLFIGGAAGQAARIFIQQTNGTFSPLNTPMFLKDHFTEDIDAALFDADGDGDADLYIVRGGNDVPDGNPLLADRLLFNDGKGVFKSKKGSLPYLAHNGSCVRPGDFDGDGDTDLFVGSRSVPGAYGWSPVQVLLENDGNGFFKNVTEPILNDLNNAGMVTDAGWMDYDRDGDPDLVVAGEWMRIRVFRNDNGTFTDVTAAAGLDETSGWWNCIQVADIDRDGDLDLIAGNLGLNSILKASVKEPVEMYLNDFDNNGSLDQVICSYHNGISYPVASLDELAAQISGLEKKYPDYADFGGKTAKDIFGEKTLNQSVLKKAVLFESCIFLNNGKGVFEIKKLPIMAQFSPVRDILVRDFDLDGNTDIVLVGNDYPVRPSIGRYDASYGWCLLGDHHQRYHVLMPVESGLEIKGDARRILPIEIHGNACLVVAVNNGELNIFRLLKE
ncbi:MAG: VCBS repeat-containing protein [Chlorobi bacterium]|nr:VCBS repeat-containing protein [Chlorobiota bacterium]